MRRQHFAWTFLVLALILTIYGVYSIIYSVSHNVEVPILAIVFLIIGGVLLLIYGVLVVITMFQKRNKRAFVKMSNERRVEIKPVEEESTFEEEEVIQPEIEKKNEKSNKKEEADEESTYVPASDVTYVRDKVSYRSSSGGSGYVSKVGSGPILRIEGNEIFDMRTTTYYTIDGNMVCRNGYGPLFEINGNTIRRAYGAYLYEISGGNVNKVYGGYFASFTGSHLKIYDGSVIYEISTSLSLRQQLAIVALLFEAY